MSSSGSGGGVTQTAFNNLAGAALQNGVVHSADAGLSAVSITTGSGAVAFTLAAANLYVLSAGGVLTAVTFAGGAQTPAAAAPASTKYAVVGVEVDTGGNIAVVKGTDTATQLNTGALIASNTPATTSGKLRLYDFAVWNNAGVYNFADHTTVATQGVNYIDRRPWARGLNATATDTNTAVLTSIPAFGTWETIPNWQLRAECSGAPLAATVTVYGYTNGQANEGVLVRLMVDGSTTTVPSSLVQWSLNTNYSAVATLSPYTPAAGSHLFQVQYYDSGVSGNHQQYLGGSQQLALTEVVRAPAGNGAA